jgi:hypothetical protein
MAGTKLLPALLQRADHFRTHYVAAVPEGVTADDVQQPEFWAHVATKLRRMDMIEVLAEDESYYAELLVMDAGVGFAKVKMLRFVELEAAGESTEANSAFKIEWKGIAKKYSVIRKSDSVTLRDGFTKKFDAETWVRGHASAMAS